MEFSQLIVNYQRKIRESSESLHTVEELSRKLTMEVRIIIIETVATDLSLISLTICVSYANYIS